MKTYVTTQLLRPKLPDIVEENRLILRAVANEICYLGHTSEEMNSVLELLLIDGEIPSTEYLTSDDIKTAYMLVLELD